MVKRYNPHSSIDVSAWIVEDAGGSVVLASDYDALAASCDFHKEMAAKWQHEAELDLARILELAAALREIGNSSSGPVPTFTDAVSAWDHWKSETIRLRLRARAALEPTP